MSRTRQRHRNRARGRQTRGLAVLLVLCLAVAVSSVVKLAANAASGSGQFHVSNGNIIDPDGNTFIAKGMAIDPSQMKNDITGMFPGTTIVRVAASPLPSPSQIDAGVKALTAKKIVVLLEHHPWPLTNALSGGELQSESNAYATLASAYKDNPYVWFGSENEPQGAD